MAQLTDDCFAFGGPLMTVEESAAIMADRVAAVSEVEALALAGCDGRVLARDVMSGLDLPPFANSAVDGYAVRFADLSADGATRLPVRGRVPAGAVPAGVEAAGAAVRVFTGAPMPAGADTVFMQEDVGRDGSAVVLPAGLRRGANARPAGEDIARGALALPAGRMLRPQDLALAAAVGLASLPVRRRVRVAVFSTGNELVEPGRALGPAAIHDSNRVMLAAMVRRAGGTVTDLGILRDEPAGLAIALGDAAREHDLIVTTGGVSTGEEDHVKAAVERAGRLVSWRIAIKPGRPVAMGVIDGAAFAGLPGNPVAVFVTFLNVVRPLMDRLAGAVRPPVRPLAVRSGFAYRKKPGRREFVRVTLEDGGDGIAEARKHPRDGAGVITSLTASDGLVVLADDLVGVAEGDLVPFLGFEQLL